MQLPATNLTALTNAVKPGLFSANNPVFQGGLGLMVIGTAGAALRQWPRKAWDLATRRLWLTAELKETDHAFLWMLRWLQSHTTHRPATSLRIVSVWEDDDGEGQRRVSHLVPGTGVHVLEWGGAKFWITITTSNSGAGGGNAPTLGSRSRMDFSTYTINVRCRKKHRAALAALLHDVDELERRPDPTKTRIYTPDYDSWSLHATKPTRSVESVVLADGLFDDLLADMRKFEERYQWYSGLGIPYRRGYLLSGPPGNGKSSLIAALAGALKRDLYVLPLGDPNMNDEKLVRFLGNAPAKSVVAIEDIDTVFQGRERKAENKLTLSGVLNALDGPLATEGRVLVMTTNHPEVLDPALVRPGRVDVQHVIGNANEAQAARLFDRFFPDAQHDHRTAFIAWAGDGTRSMAQLQAHLLVHAENVEGASRVPETSEPVAA